MAGKIEFIEGVLLSVYAMTNLFFRITSYTLAIMFFKWWSLWLFATVILMSLICIKHYNKEEQKHFNILTSAVASVFSPFVRYDDTHWMSMKTSEATEVKRKYISKQRDKLSSKIG